jgi:hypothetical protein
MRFEMRPKHASERSHWIGSAIGFDAVWIGGLDPGQVARIPIAELRK